MSFIPQNVCGNNSTHSKAMSSDIARIVLHHQDSQESIDDLDE